MDNKEMLMKIISGISVSAPDGATFQISESNGKFIIELSPKTANNKADDDPPTEISYDGFKFWKNKRGEYHRDGDLPAIVYPDGTQFWYKNGSLHRDGDLPAIVCADGTKYWCKNDKYHRDGDLPAIIFADGAKYWCKNGKFHREGNKPAIVEKTYYGYWVDGKRILSLKHENGVVEI